MQNIQTIKKPWHKLLWNAILNFIALAIGNYVYEFNYVYVNDQTGYQSKHSYADTCLKDVMNHGSKLLYDYKYVDYEIANIVKRNLFTNKTYPSPIYVFSRFGNKWIKLKKENKSK